MKRLLIVLLILFAVFLYSESTVGEFMEIDDSCHVFVPLKLSAYGGFQDKSEEITVTTKDLWYHITNGANNLFTGLEADGLTLSGDSMTFTHTGHYVGMVAITATGSNGKDFQVRLYNCTQTEQEGYYAGASTASDNNFINIAVPLHIDVTAGDILRMEIRCISDNSNPTLKNGVFWINYVHE